MKQKITFLIAFFCLFTTANFAQSILYVNANSTGNNTGFSWDNAFTDLQSALTIADTDDQIWIAKGTYKPTTDPNSKTSKFVLQNDVALYGGFAGNETNINQRNWIVNKTILSGDILGDDTSNVSFDYVEAKRTDNVHTILDVVSTSSIIDGITFTGGQSNYGEPASINRGSAIKYADNTLIATLRNCVIENNVTFAGGAVYLNSTSTELTKRINILNCEFKNNIARYASGFLVSNNENNLITTVRGCVFTDNIVSNFSASGSKIRVDGALTASAFAVFSNNGTADVIIDQCTITKNFSSGSSNVQAAVGLRKLNDTAVLNVVVNNSIIYRNTGCVGPCNGTVGILNEIFSFVNRPNIRMNDVTLLNNIFQLPDYTPSNYGINYMASANSNAIPQFVDDNNDFRLQATSPAIDAGNDNYISGNQIDILGNTRIANGILDIGAYEFGASSTLSINQNASEVTNIMLYPNPVVDKLIISTQKEIKKVDIL